jgi:branched-chain amino acid transport system permease protein
MIDAPQAVRASRRRDLIVSAVESGRGAPLVPLRFLLLIGVMVAVTLVGLGATSSLRYALAIGGIYAMSVLANSVVLGTLGEINLGSSAWLGVGAYTCTIAMQHDLPLSVSILLSISVTTVIGFLIAIPTVRLKGIFTALVTFALAFSIPQLVVYLEKYTGGSHGLSLPFNLQLFGMTVGGSEPGMLILVNVLFVIVALVTMAILESRFGKTAVWVGEAEPAAAVFGVRTTIVKVLVWTWSAAISGAAGALFALTVGFISPDQFQTFLGISLFVGAVIAGSRSMWAAWIGGAIVGVLPTQLQDFMPSSATGILFGLVLLAAILAGTGGLARLVERLIILPFVRKAGPAR